MPDFPTARVEDATDTIVVSVRALTGGEIGQTWCARLDSGTSVAVKVGPTPLDVEARSLRALADRDVPVPAVHFADEDVLILEYVPGDGWSSDAETELGRIVACLHEHTAPTYGWQEPTWKGRFRQSNPPLADWPAFFADHRLRPVADDARDADGITDDLHARTHALADDLPGLLPTNPTPRLLHGDVWENNAIADGSEVRAVVDPAPWYGHHEVELAYAHWCGLGDAFRDGYESVLDVEPEFEDRRLLYEVHFALDHAFHFPTENYDDWARDRLSRLDY